MSQLLPAIEEHPAGQRQDLLGGGGVGWLQQVWSNGLMKGEERPAAVARLLIDCLEEFSPNADWLLGKRMRKT